MTPYYQDRYVLLYHADCLDVFPLFSGVDHVITDPPYARDVYLRARAGNETHGSSRAGRPWSRSVAKMASGDIGAIDPILVRVAAEIGRLVCRWAIVFSDAETTYRWRAELEAAGLRYIRTGCWAKPDSMPQLTGDRPSVGFEPCTIVHAQGEPMRWNGGGGRALWTHGIVKGDARPDHPCPKPEMLMRELVESFTDHGETILDPFAGSGTTGVAAKRLGRRCVLVEKDERYCEVSARRLAQDALPLEMGTEPDAVARDGELFERSDAR